MARFALPLQKAVRIFALLLALASAGCATSGPARPGETIHRNIVFAKPGGHPLRLDLYVPAQPRPAPVIVWFHGGSWEFGNKAVHLYLRKLTREGFAIASPEYRFAYQARWPAQIDDARAAVNWVRANGAAYGLDPRRLGLSGESAGGHLAALVGTMEGRPQIKAVCALYPPTDLVALGRRYERFKHANIFTQMFGHDIEDCLDTVRAASPLTHIRAQTPPFLLYHGKLDFLVPVEESRVFDAALRKVGVESRLVILPHRTHAFALTRREQAETATFFHRYL
jgi:acetyl esterase/lipase